MGLHRSEFTRAKKDRLSGGGVTSSASAAYRYVLGSPGVSSLRQTARGKVQASETQHNVQICQNRSPRAPCNVQTAATASDLLFQGTFPTALSRSLTSLFFVLVFATDHSLCSMAMN